MPDGPVLIGVDCGGTSCRLVAEVAGLRTFHTLAGANAHAEPERAVATLCTGLTALRDKARIAPDVFAHGVAYVGLAGVTSDATGRAIAARLPLARVTVADDRLVAVAGALGAADGTVAGIGTGSFFARQGAGQVTLAGGWGFLLGDEASGAWLGRQLLARVLHVQDGLAPETALTRSTLAGFDGGTEGILALAAAPRPDRFAAFAPAIFAALAEGDDAAQDIVRGAVGHITRAAAAIGWQAPAPFCLIGGLAQAYAPHLPPALAACLTAPRGTALDGALGLARSAAKAAGGP